jgi:hypothetical protein
LVKVFEMLSELLLNFSSFVMRLEAAAKLSIII